MKPTIGVTCGYKENDDGTGQCIVPAAYSDAVQAAGGIPLIVAPVDVLEDACVVLDKLDGLIVTGGADMRPERYGEEAHPKTKLIPERRERFDFMLVEEAIRRDLPILAICYGCQVLNVALGGALVQDVPDQLKTDTAHAGKGAMHRVRIEKGTKVWDILQAEEIESNSSHHQAVKSVGEGVVIGARACDGVVEAIESLRHRFLLGIQWHPERLVDRKEHLALFEALVREASS